MLFDDAGDDSNSHALLLVQPRHGKTHIIRFPRGAEVIAGVSDGVDAVVQADEDNAVANIGDAAGIAALGHTLFEVIVAGGGGNAAGFASEVDALIENCNATETTVVVASPAETYPSGGLVASLYEATARNCYFSGTVDAVTYETGGYVGGIAGTCYRGAIENCFSVGEIATSLQNSAAGGLAGSLYGSIKNSYSVGSVVNESSQRVGGLVGSVGSYEDGEGTVYQSSISGSYTATSVKAYTTGYDAENDAREIIGYLQEGAAPEISNIYFNRQLSNFGSVKYGVQTSDLTKAAGVAGFDALQLADGDGGDIVPGVAGDQAADGTIRIVLAQDAGGTENEAKRMSFRTLEGFAGEGVTFESVQYPGYYMVSRDGALYLEQDPDAEAATFYVSTDNAAEATSVQKTTRLYTAGETLDTDDIRVVVETANGGTEIITECTVTNAGEIDMSTAGDKELTVSYEYNGQQMEDTVTIHVVDGDYR